MWEGEKYVKETSRYFWWRTSESEKRDESPSKLFLDEKTWGRHEMIIMREHFEGEGKAWKTTAQGSWLLSVWVIKLSPTNAYFSLFKVNGLYLSIQFSWLWLRFLICSSCLLLASRCIRLLSSLVPRLCPMICKHLLRQDHIYFVPLDDHFVLFYKERCSCVEFYSGKCSFLSEFLYFFSALFKRACLRKQ